MSQSRDAGGKAELVDDRDVLAEVLFLKSHRLHLIHAQNHSLPPSSHWPLRRVYPGMVDTGGQRTTDVAFLMRQNLNDEFSEPFHCNCHSSRPNQSARLPCTHSCEPAVSTPIVRLVHGIHLTCGAVSKNSI